MKLIISFLIGVLIFCLGFYLDGLLINHIISVIPKGVEEWLGLLRVFLWVITFSITLSFSILCGALATTLMFKIFGE